MLKLSTAGPSTNYKSLIQNTNAFKTNGSVSLMQNDIVSSRHTTSRPQND